MFFEQENFLDSVLSFLKCLRLSLRKTSIGIMALTTPTTASTDYAKLKKDLLFHEKRLHLLLSTRVVEDLPYILKERQDSRWNCFHECKEALKSLERNAATESKLSGRWSETRVSSMFGLELPLVAVCGSEKFEKPSVRADDIAKLLEDVTALSKRFSEFAPSDMASSDAEKVTFISELHSLQWSPKDMEKMKSAITSKLSVLTELTELTKALRNSQYQVSTEEMHLEELRREEEKAIEDGEMALSDAAIRDRMTSLKKVIDHLFFQAHTIDSSVDSNITKKRSNLALFQEGTAVLSCIRNDKERIVGVCRSDIARIQRGLEYDEKMRSDSRSLAMLQESTANLEQLDARQALLSEHLERIAKELHDVEQAIIDLGNARHQAMRDHMDLLESRRHLNSDTNEKIRFAEQYRANLETTLQQNERSIKALTTLEKLLLKQTSFDEYDFQATTKRLQTMQRRVAVELNRALNEYEAAGAELVRRMSAQLKITAEEADKNEVEAEVRKETFDPLAKKYVTRAKDFGSRRDKIATECRSIQEAVQAEREAIMAKIAKHLEPSEIVDNREATMLLSAARTEELLDFRQELITPPDVAILDERLRVAREYQTSMVHAASRTATRKASASRVLAVREDIERSKSAVSDDDAAGDQSAAECGSAEPDVSTVGRPASADIEVSVSSVAVEFSKTNEDRAMKYRGAARVIHQSLD